MTTSTIDTVGFIGLGVMGEPMCGHLAAKGGRAVVAYDLDAAPLARLAESGAQAAMSVAEVAERADLILLSLPGGAELEAVAAGAGGLLGHCRAGAAVVDTGTSPVALSRALAERFAERGVDYADAPVARGRAAAQTGTLSTMVGASAGVLARIRPFLECYATDVTHCGDVGAGQVVKLMNNMVLFQNVHALAEALAVGRRAGVEGAVLFDCLAKGSGDSFALHDHGMKSMPARRLPGARLLHRLRAEGPGLCPGPGRRERNRGDRRRRHRAYPRGVARRRPRKGILPGPHRSGGAGRRLTARNLRPIPSRSSCRSMPGCCGAS